MPALVLDYYIEQEIQVVSNIIQDFLSIGEVFPAYYKGIVCMDGHRYKK